MNEGFPICENSKYLQPAGKKLTPSPLSKHAIYHRIALLCYQLLTMCSLVYKLFHTFGDLIAYDMTCAILTGTIKIFRHSNKSRNSLFPEFVFSCKLC